MARVRYQEVISPSISDTWVPGSVAAISGAGQRSGDLGDVVLVEVVGLAAVQDPLRLAGERLELDLRVAVGRLLGHGVPVDQRQRPGDVGDVGVWRDGHSWVAEQAGPRQHSMRGQLVTNSRRPSSGCGNRFEDGSAL
jgi:hypothetical protein